MYIYEVYSVKAVSVLHAVFALITPTRFHSIGLWSHSPSTHGTKSIFLWTPHAPCL